MVRRQSCCNSLSKVAEVAGEKKEPDLRFISELGVHKQTNVCVCLSKCYVLETSLQKFLA